MRLGIAALLGVALLGSTLPVRADEWTKIGESEKCSLYRKKIHYSGRFRNFKIKLVGKGCPFDRYGEILDLRADCEKWSEQSWEPGANKWSESNVVLPDTKADDWMKAVCD
jgi:hypothetical protein